MAKQPLFAGGVVSTETDGLAIAHERIAEEARARTGMLDLGQLGLTELPEALFALKHLRRLNLGAGIYEDDEQSWAESQSDIAPNAIGGFLERLSELPELQALSLWGCLMFSDLALLAGLSALQSLYCGETQVSDLAPLTGLSALQSLNCARTQVSDLAPLAGLSALQSLNCGFTQVSDLAPLAGLSALQSLYCARTQVSDLAPLTGLSALQSLDCGETQVSDLAPLTGLSALQSLYCGSTQVRDLAPLTGLSALQSLYCGFTQVSDLAPLTGLSALQSLNCGGTQVSDLAPLTGLSALQSLDCSGCSLADFPRGLLDLPSLKTLVLYACHLPAVPAGVLSQIVFENCLKSLRAHVRDLEAGTVAVADVKLMVLGNGRVGKTQLCRRLRGEAYDETVASTHGVMVTSAPLPSRQDGPQAHLQIWDFGGQDIYHGTHALFTRTNAIFLLLWTPGLEDTDEHVHDGMVFRNHPLAYWVDYVRHLGGGSSPVLVVQARCDRPEDEATCPVPEADLFAAFGFRKVLRYSARTDRGRAAFDEALTDAAAWLRPARPCRILALPVRRCGSTCEERSVKKLRRVGLSRF